MVEGQCGTYLRQTRASSGPWVSVAKTYRDDTKTEMNILARSQWPSSAVEYKRKATVIWPKYSFQFSFHRYMSQRCSPTGRTTLSSVLGKCRTVPLPYLFVSGLLLISMWLSCDVSDWVPGQLSSSARDLCHTQAHADLSFSLGQTFVDFDGKRLG